MTYTLTGPQTVTRAEKVRAIGRALGRDIEYVELAPDDAVAELETVMGEYARWYVDGLAMLVQHPQTAVQTVAELAGRPGMTFDEWAVAHVAQLR